MNHRIFIFHVFYLGVASYIGMDVIAQSDNNPKQPAFLNKTTLSQSPPSTQGYCQGGVVVNGIAYFTSKDCKEADFPYVVAFDTRSLKLVNKYDFKDTFDSSPLVIETRQKKWLVIAHEKSGRTVARKLDSGEIEWVVDNHPGVLFFGFSYYLCDDGSKLILVSCTNGLHAITETGNEIWHVARSTSGGVTPCVDQAAGVVYYQYNQGVLKVDATSGEVLDSVMVPGTANICTSWNTVLVNDRYGYYIATYWRSHGSWSKKPEWNSVVRVYDTDLNLVWERTGLPIGNKATLTYTAGKLITGCGPGYDAQDQRPPNDNWKYVKAYAISDGRLLWQCDLRKYKFNGILNIPCLNGYLYAETQEWAFEGKPAYTSYLFKINAATGTLEEVLNYKRAKTSCAPPLIAHGRVFSGEWTLDKVAVTEVAKNSKAEWPGAFGDPQTHQMSVRDTNAKPVAMYEVTYSH